MESTCRLSRRSLLQAGAGLLLAKAFEPLPARALERSGRRILATPARAGLAGPGHAKTDVWAYDGMVPGPLVRLRQGVPARLIIENRLDQETTVHWHGIRLPNPMDGVPGLTQPPIKPGESFAYEFTPPDAGTFWYHPHANSLEQLGRGLAGAVIVEEGEPVAVDRDLLWLLADWRLNAQGEIAAGFGNRMEAAMSGRVGNTVTLNGSVSKEEPMRAGERVRLRLVNGSLARVMALRFEGHRPVVVAVDGQPCEPHEPEGGRILLGPAMRIDIAIDMQGQPGRRYRVIDDFYDGLSYGVTELAYSENPPIRAHPPDAPLSLPRNPLPEPDLADAERHELTLQGGMMGGGGMAGMGGMMGTGGGAAWAINGMSMTGDGHVGMEPALTFQRGRSVVLRLRNETAWWHPMHLHGHSTLVLSRNGAPVPYRQWQDTVLMAPRDTVEIAFVADNPGDWMLHCHIMDHQMAGLMTVLRVA
ncbi:multicopper oxidase family protein [Xanthobacter autotrophicus]|uniref:Multicopper oxidase family protein n=1 Tax=Xanthobacter dioxanivorans TaxID=2528964 RepID=A0A974SLL8_9HYPH|nr:MULTISPECIES: multicopper oxidase family protein [Xanthobacter]QRG10045.1 multicopper oxidase family protein [Xanthobacter dioxanivorans]UDQ91998.1 multicopper oxidase family protein [Xanthobacter autotrophicus]